MEIIKLEEVDSTNAYIMRESSRLKAPVMITAHTQTAGQGQRGNSWESEPGKNLTFSIYYHPTGLPPMAQFAMSEAVALGVIDFLRVYGIEAKVKWPNDIYVGDRKICGILIRHSIMGGNVNSSIIGVGINLNQQVFVSDAPNPVSMGQITGQRYDISALYAEIAAIMESRLAQLGEDGYRQSVHMEFMESLWRGDGKEYPFVDMASGNRFMAKIADIAAHGTITLRLGDGTERTYAFKEVSFVL